MKLLPETNYFKPSKSLTFINCVFLLQKGMDLKLAVYNRKLLPFIPPINCYQLVTELNSDTVTRWNPLDHLKDVPLICYVMKVIAEKKPYTLAAAVELLLEHVETEEPLDLFLNLDSIFRLFYYSYSEDAGLLGCKLFRRYKITNLLTSTPLPLIPKKQRRIVSGAFLEDKTTFKKRKNQVSKHRIIGLGAQRVAPSLLDYYMPIDIAFLPFKIKGFSLVKKTKYEVRFGAYGRAR